MTLPMVAMDGGADTGITFRVTEEIFAMMTEHEQQRPDAGPAFDELPPPPEGLYDEPGTTGPPPPASLPAGDLPSSDSRNIAAIAHLSAFSIFAGIPSFIGPLVIWLLQRDRDTFVAEEAREALNFNLSILLYTLAAIAAMILTLGLGLIVIIPVALVAAPAWLVLTVLAAIRAADGQPYRYPLTLRLIN